MSESCPTYQECCLYFTANSLSRLISYLADESISRIGLPTSYAHLMLQLIEEPGLRQNELSKRMNLKASTMTRFIDKLIVMGYVERRQNGKYAEIFPTAAGEVLKSDIKKALEDLYHNYCAILGQEYAMELTAAINKANTLLNKSLK